MMSYLKNAKYQIQYTSRFKKEFKKIIKQGKDEIKFLEVLNIIANGGNLEQKYKNHKLVNDKIFKDCNECYIEPDWLLVYKYQDDKLILLLFVTGRHSDLFNK